MLMAIVEDAKAHENNPEADGDHVNTKAALTGIYKGSSKGLFKGSVGSEKFHETLVETPGKL